MSVCVVIVSRNRFPLLRAALEALGTEHQIIVVDNGSAAGVDALEADFPTARFIKLPKNFGLTKAMNIGYRSGEGDFVLFLHDDTQLTSAGVEELATVLESNGDVGAVAPLLVDRYGTPVPQILDLPSAAQPYVSAQPFASAAPEDVPCVSGAAVMVRRSFLQSMPQLDERYGSYGCDLDLCAQVIRRAGKKIRVVPSVRAVQGGEATEEALAHADRENGIAVFLGKYYGAGGGWLYRLRSTLGALLRFRLGLAKSLITGQKIDGTQ